MRRLSVLLLLALTTACNKEVTDPPPPATNTVVASANNTFLPQNAPVRVGGTITWNFLSIAHSVIFESAGAPDDINVPVSNTTEARTFTTAGVYTYHCGVHPTIMTGSITVIAP